MHSGLTPAWRQARSLKSSQSTARALSGESWHWGIPNLGRLLCRTEKGSQEQGGVWSTLCSRDASLPPLILES